jgi:hypothetical protein
VDEELEALRWSTADELAAARRRAIKAWNLLTARHWTTCSVRRHCSGSHDHYSNNCSNTRNYGAMSKNRHYGTDVSRAAINEFLTRPAPVTLTPEEIGSGPVQDGAGESIDVWLRFVEIRVQERAVVLAYTDRAVQVEVTRRDGSTYRVWVWRGAVTTPGRDR